MKRFRLLEEWNSFRANVIPVNASEIQITEMRRAFYAGAVATFAMQKKAAGDIPEMLEDLLDELSQYHRDVKEGKA